MSRFMKPDDDVYTWQEWVANVKNGLFTDYDGFGELATDNSVFLIRVYPSQAEYINPKHFTHVCWHNR